MNLFFPNTLERRRIRLVILHPGGIRLGRLCFLCLCSILHSQRTLANMCSSTNVALTLPNDGLVSFTIAHTWTMYIARCANANFTECLCVCTDLHFGNDVYSGWFEIKRLLIRENEKKKIKFRGCNLPLPLATAITVCLRVRGDFIHFTFNVSWFTSFIWRATESRSQNERAGKATQFYVYVHFSMAMGKTAKV